METIPINQGIMLIIIMLILTISYFAPL